MNLVCGLGNPGNTYKYTRHNIGFLFLDDLAIDEGFSFKKEKKFNAFSCKGVFLGAEVLFLKPQTYMNLSGESIQPACTFYKIKPEDLIVIHDDVDLPFGNIKIKLGGGTAGHNGLKSIVSKIGNNFIRIRVGIGKSSVLDTSDYVLQKFSREEIEEVPGILARVHDALKMILEDDIKKAMNEFN